VTALVFSIHNIGQLNDLLGVPLRFLPSGASTNAVTITINLDGGGTLGPTALKRVTTNLGLQALSNGELQSGVITEITYDGTEFVITSPIDMTPIGNSVEVRGSTAPAGTLIEDGSCYSQTQYAALFVAVSTTYNAGAPSACSGGQFAVPYSNGTMFLAKDNQGANTANRVTSAGSGCVGTTLANLCGGQNQALTPSQIPGINSTGPGLSATLTGNATSINQLGLNVGAGSTGTYVPSSTGGSSSPLPVTVSGTTASQGVSSVNTGGQAHPILNPLLIGLRAIKY
jgi:hypothetical protein